jgi:hypothetical protein
MTCPSIRNAVVLALVEWPEGINNERALLAGECDWCEISVVANL